MTDPSLGGGYIYACAGLPLPLSPPLVPVLLSCVCYLDPSPLLHSGSGDFMTWLGHFRSTPQS